MSISLIKNRIAIESLSATLPKVEGILKRTQLYTRKNQDLLGQVTDIISLYIGEKEWELIEIPLG